MNDLLQRVPESRHELFRELVGLLDAFCDKHLNDEYKLVCRRMAADLCQDGSPVDSGWLAGWAAGVVHSVGWVNFLGDPSQTPHMRSDQIAKGFGVSMATMMNRSREIRQGLELVQFDPDFTLPSKLDDNPLVWLLPLKDGPIVDVRLAPREFQEAAFREGMIPYIPADRGAASQTSNPRVIKG